MPFAEQIKQKANIATMAVGMISEPQHANSIIENDQADLVALGREALMNPNWPLHAMRELTEDKNFDSWPPNSGWWLEVRQRMLNSSNPNDWKVGPAAKIHRVLPLKITDKTDSVCQKVKRTHQPAQLNRSLCQL